MTKTVFTKKLQFCEGGTILKDSNRLCLLLSTEDGRLAVSIHVEFKDINRLCLLLSTENSSLAVDFTC